MTSLDLHTPAALADAERWTAHNYHPLPVVIADAEGAWVTDVDGKRYLDCLAGYSALNFGHRHPALIAAAREQLDRVTLTSRAFLHDQFGPFCRELAELCDAEMVLPMNTGAEAVETAVKVSRAWGYRVKGVPDGQATIGWVRPRACWICLPLRTSRSMRTTGQKYDDLSPFRQVVPAASRSP